MRDISRFEDVVYQNIKNGDQGRTKKCTLFEIGVKQYFKQYLFVKQDFKILTLV